MKQSHIQNLILKIPEESIGYPIKLNSAHIEVNYNLALRHKKRFQYLFTFFYLWLGTYPKIIKAKKPLATFQLKKGKPVGLKLTMHKPTLRNFFLIFLFDLALLDQSTSFTCNNPSLATSSAHLGVTNYEALIPSTLEAFGSKFTHSHPNFGLNIIKNLKSLNSHIQPKSNMVLSPYFFSSFSIPNHFSQFLGHPWNCHAAKRRYATCPGRPVGGGYHVA